MAEDKKIIADKNPGTGSDGKLRRDTFRQSVEGSEFQRRHARRRKEKRKARQEEKLRRKSRLKSADKGDSESGSGRTAAERSAEKTKEKTTGKNGKRSDTAKKAAGKSAEKFADRTKSRNKKNPEAGLQALPQQIVDSSAEAAKALAVNGLAQQKASEEEDENSAVDAVHGTQKAAESAYVYEDYQTRQKKKERDKQEEKKSGRKPGKTARKAADDQEAADQEKMAGDERMSGGMKSADREKTADDGMPAEDRKKFGFRKGAAEKKTGTDPEHQQEVLRKLQRRKMQKEYAKAVEQGMAEAEAGKAAVRSVSGRLGEIGNQLKEYVSDYRGRLVSMGCLIMIFVLMINYMSSCGTLFEGITTTTFSAAYLSEPDDLDAAEVYLTQKEMKLQTKIDNIETTYPGYDEYEYNLGTIEHNPFTLLNYLSAKYTRFTFDEVKDELNDLFSDMYTLTRRTVTETRTREVQTKDEDGRLLYDADGDPVMTTEEYEVRILQVTLIAASLDILVAGRMTDDEKSIYQIYQESKGLLQQFASPVDYYWYLYISSYYGYRKNSHTNAEEFHKGLDISVPTGSKVYSGQDGTVETVGYNSTYGNYVSITDEEGYTTKYAFLQSASVHRGDKVTMGQQIGKSGSTGSAVGSQLHIECLYNGTYYNPLLYFSAGTETLHGEEATGTGPAGGFGAGGTIAPDAYDDPTVQRLMEEAVKYIGYPYVWGGSSPSTSFDCSGFVSWVYNASGVHPMGRMTAQGIYDHAVVVSPSEAKAGDMIVFTGTYKSAGPVSHIGIYCGNGTMLHCGNPIGYANIYSSYWQQHFYAFIRWP